MKNRQLKKRLKELEDKVYKINEKWQVMLVKNEKEEEKIVQQITEEENNINLILIREYLFE